MEHKYLNGIQQKIDNTAKNVFLCHRGTTALGGEIARLLYYNLLVCNYPELVPFCSSLYNVGVNFQTASYESIRSSCKVFVAIFTENFCPSALNKDDDQVRKELAILFGEMYDRNNNKNAIQIVPVFAKMNDESPDPVSVIVRDLLPWFKKDLTIEILREEGYFKDETDENILKKIKHFIEEYFIHGSNPVLLQIDSKLDTDPLLRKQNRLQNALADVVELIKQAYDRKMVKSNGKIWIGTRLSDIEHTGDFLKGAVTLFGKNDEQKQLYALCDASKNKRVDHNIQEKEQDDYLREKMHEIVNNCTDLGNLSFYFYNQLSKYTIGGLEDISNYCICVNDEEVLKKLSNKVSFQQHYRGAIGDGKGLLEVEPGNASNCDYASLCTRFKIGVNDGYKFVVQAAVASGGSGTYIMTKENAKTLQPTLSPTAEYLYSVYREKNVPVNMHALIFETGVVLLPGSIQLMRIDYEEMAHESEVKRLMYRGADFIEYRRLASLPDSPEHKVNSRHIERFKTLCLQLCEKLRTEEHYRGILGIDGMIYGDEVRLLEVNCRFQASTGLINRALEDAGKDSVQKANFDAFYNPAAFGDWKKTFDELEVNYSNYSFNNIGCNEHPHHIFEIARNSKAYEGLVEADGYTNALDLNTCPNTAHLFRLNFKTNICWVNEEGCVLVNENISEPIKGFKNQILSCATSAKIEQDALLAMKIALLTQGVVIESSTLEYLENSKAKGIRPATNSAVDISFSKAFMGKCGFARDVSAFVINAPRDIKFNEFTPFLLRRKPESGKDALALYYYGNEYDAEDGTELAEVSLYPLDPIETGENGKRTRRGEGVLYEDVAYLSTDRLRVHVTNSCIFKEGNLGCQFCNIEKTCADIDLRDIREVVDTYWARREEIGLRHFLIGGQSPAQNEKMQEKLKGIIEHIHSLTPQPAIYAMILPCQTEQGLETYYDLVKSYFEKGLTELALNIEIFDDMLAKKYMPGKGRTSREMYKECLIKARKALISVLDKCRAPEAKEKIRTMVIYGLEPDESFMEGIRWLIKSRIQPIISLFRPLKNTPLENCVAPPMVQVYNLYKKIEAMYAADKSAMNLGPVCSYCQNNTLSLPVHK